MPKKFYLYFNIFSWGLVLFLIGNYVFGWTTPTQDPPGGNVVLESGATPAGSTGYIQFNGAGTLGADANLFWDNINKHLGVGTTSPAQKLHVAGNLRVEGAIVAPEGALRDDAGGWVRTYGATGWYSQTYGGGWYMTDTTYLRPYNSKQILALGGIHMNNTKITNLASPSSATDAATKGYVDDVTTRVLQIKRVDGLWVNVGPIANYYATGALGTDGIVWTLNDNRVFRDGVLYTVPFTVTRPRVANRLLDLSMGDEYCSKCTYGHFVSRTPSTQINYTVCTNIRLTNCNNCNVIAYNRTYIEELVCGYNFTDIRW